MTLAQRRDIPLHMPTRQPVVEHSPRDMAVNSFQQHPVDDPNESDDGCVSKSTQLARSTPNTSAVFEMAAEMPPKGAVTMSGGPRSRPLATKSPAEPPKEPDGSATKVISRGIAKELSPVLVRGTGRSSADSSTALPDRDSISLERQHRRGLPRRSDHPRHGKPQNVKPTMYWVRPRDGRRPGAWGRVKDALTGQGPDVFVVINGDSRPRRRDCPSVGEWSGWRWDRLTGNEAFETPGSPHDRKVHVEVPWARRTRSEKYNFWTRRFESQAERMRTGSTGRLMDQALWTLFMQQMFPWR